MSNFSQKTQFDYLYDALAQKYPGIQNADGRSTLFQFVTTPLAAAWKSGNDAQAYDIANAVPKNLDGFYVHGDALDISYQDLIQTIKPTSKDINERYRALTRKIDVALEANRNLRNEALSDYNVWRANNLDAKTGLSDMSFSQWLQDEFGGADWQKQLNEKKKALDTLTFERDEITRTMDSALFNARERINPDKMDKMNISQNGTAAVSVPKVTIDGNLTKDLESWINRPEGQYDFDVRINAQETIKSPWRTTYETKVTGNCFKLKTEVHVDTKRIISDTRYELRFTAVGLNSYNITRGSWFSPAFVRPDIELVDGAPLTNDDFFSANGALHLLPNNILVMYRPTISITMSKSCYQQTLGAYADVELSWIELFGFRLNFGASGKLQPIDNGDTTMIVLRSPENAAPQIVGITSSVVHNGH